MAYHIKLMTFSHRYFVTATSWDSWWTGDVLHCVGVTAANTIHEQSLNTQRTYSVDRKSVV